MDSLSAPDYILQNFEASDRIAVLVRSRKAGETIQRITTATNAASHDFQAWLRHKNVSSDVYIGMNTLRHDAQSRTKEDIEAIRHLYLDIDRNGPSALEAVETSALYHGPTMSLRHRRKNIKSFGRSRELPKIRQRPFSVRWCENSAAIPLLRILRAFCDYQNS